MYVLGFFVMDVLAVFWALGRGICFRARFTVLHQFFKTIDIVESIQVDLVSRPSKTIDLVESIQVEALPDLLKQVQKALAAT